MPPPFLKATSIVDVRESAYRRLADAVVAFGDNEGFCAHQRAAQQWQCS